ncbi:hypothetical protein Pen02_43630 [Plantactinospora endophytica]|uniref:Uncharacterized protein n=1 Tax=Plantactinospora endophytica TaxID=673535 RepID=A0ABQ4E3Z8_9ACTN|nr:hypothetical protein Pen02_43630 [Plantactinospora endophytica]
MIRLSVTREYEVGLPAGGGENCSVMPATVRPDPLPAPPPVTLVTPDTPVT